MKTLHTQSKQLLNGKKKKNYYQYFYRIHIFSVKMLIFMTILLSCPTAQLTFF